MPDTDLADARAIPLRGAAAGRWAGGTFLVLGVVLLALALRLPMTAPGGPGPALLPAFTAVGWLLCAGYLLLKPDAPGEELPELPRRDGAVRVVSFVGVCAIYAVLLEFGYYTATVVFFYFALWITWRRGPTIRGLVSLAAGTAFEALFVDLLHLPLP